MHSQLNAEMVRTSQLESAMWGTLVEHRREVLELRRQRSYGKRMRRAVALAASFTRGVRSHYKHTSPTSTSGRVFPYRA